MYIEEKYLDLAISLLYQQPANGKSVAAIVSGAGDYNDTLAEPEAGYYLTAYGCGCAFHKFQAVYLLGATGIETNIRKRLRTKNLHTANLNHRKH